MIKDYTKPIKKIKHIYRPPRKVNYKGHTITIKYRREKIEVYKCKHCDFKHLNLEKNGKYLKVHLTSVHKLNFIKGQSQQTKVQNTILVLNNFDKIISKELFWVCPFCKKKFLHTLLYGEFKGKEYFIEQRQIKQHLDSCPKMTRNCTKKGS